MAELAEPCPRFQPQSLYTTPHIAKHQFLPSCKVCPLFWSRRVNCIFNLDTDHPSPNTSSCQVIKCALFTNRRQPQPRDLGELYGESLCVHLGAVLYLCYFVCVCVCNDQLLL